MARKIEWKHTETRDCRPSTFPANAVGKNYHLLHCLTCDSRLFCGNRGTTLIGAAWPDAALANLLLQITPEDFIACSIDDRIEAGIDEADQCEEDEHVAI